MPEQSNIYSRPFTTKNLMTYFLKTLNRNVDYFDNYTGKFFLKNGSVLSHSKTTHFN